MCFATASRADASEARWRASKPSSRRSLETNNLTGTLPAWDAPGAFPELKDFWLRDNNFVGTLPDWKRNGNFPALEHL